MDRHDQFHVDLQRRLGELEHQLESGVISFREYRAARGELQAMLDTGDTSSDCVGGSSRVYSTHRVDRGRELDMDMDRQRRRAA